MKTTVQPAPVAVKKRSTYRRLLLLTALLLFGSIAGWMIWGAIRDWADAKALQDYFTELEAREPGWQDRVYGKPLTQAQLDDHQRWAELQQLEAANSAAWGPYRQGLYGGMYQDAAEPAASLPAEQAEFLKMAHQFWQPVLQKLSTIEKLTGLHRHLDRNAPYEKMIAEWGGMHTSTAYVINEAVELEVMYHISMNDPEQAFKWFTWCKPSSRVQNYYSPFLVERWLNLTQPQPNTLLQMQQLLEQQTERYLITTIPNFGAEIRLTEKFIRELASGDLPTLQIERWGVEFGLLGRDSAWNTTFLAWLRPFYLKYRIGGIFQRPNHLILRLHQLADQVEELPKLDPAIRWSTWKNFAQAQSILFDRANNRIPEGLTTYSDTIPQGLFLLWAKYVHWQITFCFDQQAQLNTALAAVIAERFRLDHGRFPVDWAELVPGYIAQPVRDPFSGKPLQIKLNEKGIVIYSFGHLGKDEGGENLWNYGGRAIDFNKTNLGTRVYLPALRRGPATQLESNYLDALKESKRETLRLLKEKKEE